MFVTRFGPVQTEYWAKEMPVAASQMFLPRSAHFIYLDSSGHVTFGATSTDKLYGWALVPQSFQIGSTAASNGYWTSSATAGADKVSVIPFACNLHIVYRVPTTPAGGLAVAARCGETCDIVGTNDGTIQYATPGTTSTDVLLVVGIPEDGDTNQIYVCANEGEIQKDT